MNVGLTLLQEPVLSLSSPVLLKGRQMTDFEPLVPGLSNPSISMPN